MRWTAKAMVVLAMASLGATCGPKAPPHWIIAAYGDSLTSHGKWFDALPGAWIPLDHGVAGETCAQIVSRLEAEIDTLVADRVVILCGTNDVRSGAYDADATVASIAAGMAAAQSAGISVVIGAPPPQFDAIQGVVNTRLSDLRDRLETLAVLNGAELADIWSVFWSFGDPLPLYSPDFIHPNSAGEDEIGNEIRLAICCR